MSGIFDEIIERRNTDSLKYDFAEQVSGWMKERCSAREALDFSVSA